MFFNVLKVVKQLPHHGIIVVHSPPRPPPPKFRSPFDTKALGPPLIYLVGPLAISDSHNTVNNIRHEIKLENCAKNKTKVFIRQNIYFQ